MNPDPFLSPWLIWFLLGIILAVLELMVPGFVLLFFGIGCWAVAGALQIWDLSVTQQVAVFLVTTIASIIVLRRRFVGVFRGSASKEDGEGFDDFPAGAHVTVVKRITPQAHGRIQHRGTLWDATADEEIAENETVEIVRYADHSRVAFFVKKVQRPS